MNDEVRKRSIDNLQRVYTVVISLAMTESLRRLLSAYADTGVLPELPAVLTVISLIVTIIPFYHGANRYLDATYITGERWAQPAALMLDFVAIFIEGITFFVLALLIRNTPIFYTLLSLLFFFDAIWVGITKLTTESKSDHGWAYHFWLGANLAAGLFILFSIWSNASKWTLWPTEMVQSIAVMVIVIVRTVLDYATVWSFYVPSDSGLLMPLPRPAPVPETKMGN